MSRTVPAQLAPVATPTVYLWLRSTGIVLAASAFVAVSAHLALPLNFTPVPLTLGPLAVLILGFMLSPRMAAASLTAYLAEGALGLPVFAPSPLSGVAHLLGPTGGYLVAFPLAVVLVSFLWRRSGRSFTAALLSAAVGNAAILFCGALWLSILIHASTVAAFSHGILPFLPGDVLKVAAAAEIASGLQRLRRRAS